MPRGWSSTDRYNSNLAPATRGLELVRRYAAGEQLTEAELGSMRATMYLIVQYVRPPRAWEDFSWQGPEHFVREIWPEVKDRADLIHGFFADGSKTP